MLQVDRKVSLMTDAEKLDVVKTVSARIFINLTKEYAANTPEGNARTAIAKAIAYLRELEKLQAAIKNKEVTL
jgi:ABC-type taurine transport system substrate-binding protein